MSKIQESLKVRGFYDGFIDGKFGPKTKLSVISFQLKNDLNGDGVVGPKTWTKLILHDGPQLPLLFIPTNREEVYTLFGDPLENGYWKRYGGFCETPKELDHVFKYQNEGKNGFWCNQLLIPVFSRVYEEITKSSLAKELKSFDGCYNVRYIRGGKELSMHSWGIAVDHNASTNLLGTEGDMNRDVVRVFESCGFFWGGNFKRKDPMHFEFTHKGV